MDAHVNRLEYSENRLSQILVLLAFVALAVFILFSNRFDWDHFFSAAEVELRSWLLDKKPPLWSYQFCGGTTRAGDPQSFGLSPIFLPILLFGSFFGLKILVFSLFVIGFIFAFRIASLFYSFLTGKENFEAQTKLDLRLLSLLFVFGNYFLWHVHHGHITFALIFLLIAIFYYFLKAIISSISAKDLGLLSVFSFCYFSAGIYHSIVFFALPSAIAGFLLLVFLLMFRSFSRLVSSDFVSNILKAGAAAAIGLILASYKLFYIFQYQRLFPRDLRGMVNEQTVLLKTFLFQAIPTFRYNFVVGSHTDPFLIWEYSAFNWLFWITGFAAITSVVVRLRRKQVFQEVPNPKWAFVGAIAACFAVAGAYFSLGDSWQYSGFVLMNKLLSGSVRVVGRYQVMFAFAFFILAVPAYIYLKTHFARRLRPALVLLLGLTLINFLTFYTTLDPASAFSIPQSPYFLIEKMQVVATARPRNDQASYNYPVTLTGAAVLNCYQPMARPTVVSAEFASSQAIVPLTMLPLLADETKPGIPQACIDKTYFTQNELVIDQSCPKGVCFNLNAENIYSKKTQLHFDPKRRMLCL